MEHVCVEEELKNVLKPLNLQSFEDQTVAEDLQQSLSHVVIEHLKGGYYTVVIL